MTTLTRSMIVSTTDSLDDPAWAESRVWGCGCRISDRSDYEPSGNWSVSGHITARYYPCTDHPITDYGNGYGDPHSAAPEEIRRWFEYERVTV